jgi:CDP-glucose 4,6-dehydratase
MTAPAARFWQGRRVLLTGHTGFKGSWAALWLRRAGAIVTGLALPPDTDPALFDLARVEQDLDEQRMIDLCDSRAVSEVVQASRPEVVLHLAAQAIVSRGARNPRATFATNVLGTVNLLDALRETPGLAAVLVVTSDKVYENRGEGRAFVESDRLGGRDPYSASKAAAEIAVHSYMETCFAPRGVPVATARGGNVIGGGDFGEDRLVPDIFRAFRRGEAVTLRRPDAIRPWQHVLDCIVGYLAYAEALAARRDVPLALNFGPSGDRVRVSDIAQAVLDGLGAGSSWRSSPASAEYDAQTLLLDSALARRELGWTDRLGGRLAIDWTAEWYRDLNAGADMRAATLAQIDAYRVMAAAEPAETLEPVQVGATR